MNSPQRLTPGHLHRSNVKVQAISPSLLSVALGTIGQPLLKYGVSQVGEIDLSLSTLVRVETNLILLLALAIYGIGAILWLLALMIAPTL